MSRPQFGAEITTCLLRGLKALLEGLLEDEVSTHLGAARYERTKSRQGHRNGHDTRDRITQHRLLRRLRIRRLLEGGMDFTCFDHYARRQGFIDAAIGQLFLQGISTRKLKSIAQDLFGAPVSTGTVSNVASALDADLQVYQSKPLADDIVFLFLDGASQKVREIGLEGKVMLCAFGIHADGTKELLSFRLVEVEDTENGRGFLVDLKSRVLKGQALKLNIGDGKAALLRALREFYPLRRIQRCIAHKLRNVVGKMKRALRAPCMAEAKRIFGAPSRGEAIRPFKGWRER